MSDINPMTGKPFGTHTVTIPRTFKAGDVVSAPSDEGTITVRVVDERDGLIGVRADGDDAICYLPPSMLA